ncbi:MAG: hypothetical protein IT473_13830 [Lysobacter sp.]|nr:hypothetical protein [Lysobacter sp.]
MLVLLSALAAAVIAVPMGWISSVLDSEGASSNADWYVHLHITLPAIVAVALSAWWHSRGRRIVECPDGTLSSRIAWWSFPIFAAILAVEYCLERAVTAERVAGLAGDLILSATAIFVLVMLASLILFLPALFVEYTVVRLVRSKRMRAVLSGVES